MQKLSVYQQVLVGISATLMTIFSQMAIPLPLGVPITFQTFIVIIIAIVLEDQLGTLAIFIYILLGCSGLPVFSGFQGGLPRVFGPTGGFMIGFIMMAWLVGRASRTEKRLWIWTSAYIGLGIDYFIGTMQLSFVTQMDFKGALMAGVYPFIFKDLVMVGLGAIAAQRIKLLIKRMRMKIS